MDNLTGARQFPIRDGSWIIQYDYDVFVSFDPTTDGAYLIGAHRTLTEAESAVAECGR